MPTSSTKCEQLAIFIIWLIGGALFLGGLWIVHPGLITAILGYGICKVACDVGNWMESATARAGRSNAAKLGDTPGACQDSSRTEAGL